MKDKSAYSVEVIGGADGPTSFFIGGGRKRKSLRQRAEGILYNIRKKRIIKSIEPNPHSLEQVAAYITDKLGFAELDKANEDYQFEYKEMRTSFILKYKPELLGALADIPKLKRRDEEGVREFIEKMEQRQKAAENIPVDAFDIDLHIYVMDNKADSEIIIERNYNCISGSSTGSKREIRKFNKLYRDIYKYYGVSKEDIENNSERFKNLIRVLA